RAERGRRRHAGRPGHVPGRGHARLVRAVVVAAYLVPVGRVAEGLRVELGGVLDLLLGPVHVDPLLLGVDVVDRTGREQDLLAEDPWSGVDDQVAVADDGARLVDLPDVSV